MAFTAPAQGPAPATFCGPPPYGGGYGELLLAEAFVHARWRSWRVERALHFAQEAGEVERILEAATIGDFGDSEAGGGE